jgi:hypothetical protein
MARPKKKIDGDLVKKLASIQCTMIEIAAVVGCSVDTLERRYADIIKEGKENGKMSLRRKQYEVAMTGNTGMLVWLGKQYLGQSDKVEEKVEQAVKQEVTYVAEWGGVSEPAGNKHESDA